MVAINIVSPEKQAQKKFAWAIFIWMLIAIIVLEMLQTRLISVLNGIGVQDHSKSGALLVFPAMQIAKYFAKQACRTSGTSHHILRVEKIQRTANQFPGAKMEWLSPKPDFKSSLLSSGLWVICALTVSWLLFLHQGATSFVWCPILLLLVLVANSDGIVYGWAKDVQIGSHGLTFSRALRPRRHVAWSAVAEVEVESLINYLNKGEGSDLLTFKDQGGKVFTKMELGSWSWRSAQEVCEIEAEIRRRLTIGA